MTFGRVVDKRLPRLTIALLLLLAWHPQSAFAQGGELTPVELTTGMRANPLGIAAHSVVFGWNLAARRNAERNLKQSAYRIQVASSAAQLLAGRADVWDSGRAKSESFWQLPYGGTALRPYTRYCWRAQVWDGQARAGTWSQPADFTIALGDADWQARWIGNAQDQPLPAFLGNFHARKAIASALVYVTGLGQYELQINGADVTQTVMNPGWTNYRKTIPYDTYDVTSRLRRGSNTFTMLLGNGMYNVRNTKDRYTKFAASIGAPVCRLQMEVLYKDGTSARFMTDEAWKTHAGPIVFSSIYGGEDNDARMLPVDWQRPTFKAAGWASAQVVSGPGGVMAPEEQSPMVIAQRYQARAVTTPQPGVTVYDLGENMSGWPELQVSGNAGDRVTMLPGELRAEDGTVSQRSTNSFAADPVLFRYTLRGGGRVESWHPRFSYHSFRYVQVTVEPVTAGGLPPRVIHLVGDFVHARAGQVGSFESSDELFNRIHLLIDRAVLSNLASIVTDCPSREKLGWLEQTYLNAGTLLFNYDVTGLYEKMSNDIAEAQLESGLVPSIAPEYVAFVDQAGKSGPFRDSPEWGSAIVLSPWALYQYTGDARPIAANYENMKRYAAYITSRAKDGILNYGLGDWYDIGPKAPGPSQLTDRTVTATGVYYEDLVALARIAQMLGHALDAEDYRQQALVVRDRFNARLFHADSDQYDRGSQTANALPLALGLVPPGHEAAVLEHLVDNIHAHADHVTSGDVGFHYVVRALTEGGRSDVLAAMFSRTDAPSYGYQLSRGATTLTEAWDANPESSQNHFMLGHGEEWFYRGLAGLSVDMSRGPEDAIMLRPSLLSSVGSASASYLSAMGRINLSWRRSVAEEVMDITIPVGAQAHLALPAGTWMEGRTLFKHVPGVRPRDSKSTLQEYILGSGTYHLNAKREATPLEQTTAPSLQHAPQPVLARAARRHWPGRATEEPPGARHSGPETTAQRDARMAWFREARFGMFIHWGLYSIPAGTWNSRIIPGIGEWIMNYASIPVADYKALAPRFNPQAFNAHDILALAKTAGMKYIIITAKHHDGFAMFASKADPFNIVDATPFKRNPLRELAEECRKQGIKLGFYYSQNQDWTAPGGAAIVHGDHNKQTGHWDKAQDGDFDEYLRTKSIPQIKELLENYKEFPVVLWFDTPTKLMTPARSAEFVTLQNEHPNLIWNNRLGGTYEGDTDTPEQYIPARGFPGRDWEACMTINDTWGYKSDDLDFKSAEILLRNLIDIASKGGNYLLNIGPDSNGNVPPPEVGRLREMGKWLAVNGAAIYGTKPTLFGDEAGSFSTTAVDQNGTPKFVPSWDWRSTTTADKVYIELFKWPSGTFHLDKMPRHVTRAYLLADPTRRSLKFVQTAAAFDVSLSAAALDPIATVLVLETR